MTIRLQVKAAKRVQQKREDERGTEKEKWRGWWWWGEEVSKAASVNCEDTQTDVTTTNEKI